MTIWTKIRDLFSRSKQVLSEPHDAAAGVTAVPALDQQTMVNLMHRLEKTVEGVYSCEEAFALLDEYVELVANDDEAKKLMPMVKNHLDMCPDCRDEFEILLDILKTADA